MDPETPVQLLPQTVSQGGIQGAVTPAPATYGPSNADANSQISNQTYKPSNNGIVDVSGQTPNNVASAFVNPQAQTIYNNILTASNLQNTPNYNNTPLSGLTTLGAVNAAGNTNINTAATNALTAGQIAQINALNATAQGQGPSPASVAAAQTAQANVANEMAMIASQRGSSNSALGLRNANNAMAVANQQGVQAAVAGKTQEELNAQNALTNALGTTNSQAASVAQAQANLNQTANLQNASAYNQAVLQQGSMNQQVNLSNQTAQTATQGLNANEYNAALQSEMTQSNNDVQMAENYENMATNQSDVLTGLAAGQAINTTNNMLGLTGAGIAGAGGVAATLASAASDINLKKNITSGERSIKSFLSELSTLSKQGKSSFKLWDEV